MALGEQFRPFTSNQFSLCLEYFIRLPKPFLEHSSVGLWQMFYAKPGYGGIGERTVTRTLSDNCTLEVR